MLLVIFSPDKYSSHHTSPLEFLWKSQQCHKLCSDLQSYQSAIKSRQFQYILFLKFQT